MTTPAATAANDSHSRISDQYFATVSNPPFDPRRYSTHPSYAGLQQGLLLRNATSTISQSDANGATTTLPSGVPQNVKLRFLYNPSTFSVSYAPSDSSPIMAANNTGNTDSQDAATLMGGSTTSCSFSLLFDRTYELMNPAGTQFSHMTGVNVDTQVFTQLIGIPPDGNGLPLYLPVQLYMGGVNTLAFYGIITQAGVEYTHFTVNMVPIRAVVSITMQQWIDATPVTQQGTAGHTTGAASVPRAGTKTPSPLIGTTGIQGLIDQINKTLPKVH